MIRSQAGIGWRATLSAVELCGGEREIIWNIDLLPVVRYELYDKVQKQMRDVRH